MKEKEIYKIIMQEFRCSGCNKLLFKAKIHGDFKIEIKCPRCKKTIEFNRKTKNTTL